MEGESKEFNNNFNLFDFFSKITLIPSGKQSILNDKAIFGSKFANNYQFTFRDVYQQVIKINNFLFEKINFKNDFEKQKHGLVGVYLKTDQYTVQVLLGILSLGLTYLPIDPSMPKERISYILNDAKPLCVISNINQGIIEDCFRETKIIFLSDIFNKENELENNIIKKHYEYDSNSAACLIYTSGSTGLPKGVLISHKSIMNRLNWQWLTFDVSSENHDVGALKTSLSFVDHIAEIFAFVLKGLPLCIIGPDIQSRTFELLNTIEEFKITYFICVPSVLEKIITFAISSNQTGKLNSIKKWVCSGEELTLDLLNSFWHMNLNNETIVSNFYGSTELTADLTFISFTSKAQMTRLLNGEIILPIGRPISNSKFYLFDENLNKVKNEGEIGEIYAGGDVLAIGYLNDMNNESRFVHKNNERLFRTGDYGFIKNDLLYFSGRKDTQIKIRGKRFDLNELTYFAKKNEYIESFLPLTVKINTDTKIIGYYIAKKDCFLSEAQINKIIFAEFKLRLLDYVIPNYLFKLNEQFPMLYNGKVDKQKLINDFKEKIKIENKNFNQDHEPIIFIDQIINIIQNITGINYKNIYNNGEDITKVSFEALGVHSLNAFEAYFNLNKIVNFNSDGRNLSFENFLSCKNISELASFIQMNSKFNESEITESTCQDNKLDETPYRVEFLINNKERIREINEMICDNFLTSNPLFKNESLEKEYFLKELKNFDDFFLDSQESFVILDKESNELFGGGILFNFNLFEEYPDPKISQQLKYIYVAGDSLVYQVAEKMLKKTERKILFADYVFLKKNLEVNEKLIFLCFIEQTIINLAKKFKYDEILVVNLHPVTNVSFLKH